MKMCSKCHKEFSIWVVIDGLKKNLGGRKYCLECSPFGKRNHRQLHIERRHCLSCGKLLDKQKKYCGHLCRLELARQTYIERWLRGEESGVTAGIHSGEAVSAYIVNWIKETRGNKCEMCGWNSTNQFTGLIPLNLHHEDGDHGNNRPENLKLLCPNCHSLTERFGSRNKGQGKFGNKGRGPLKKRVAVRVSNICLCCGKEFVIRPSQKARKFCSAMCACLSQRKVVRPSCNQLAEMIKTISMVKIGEQFGVSDNTVRKWAKSYCLEIMRA
jgi:hypothetical protein